ncbi:RELT-like protein 2 [Polymixia lowei]
MTDMDTLGVGEPPPPYMIFLLVFLFFVTGLLGFLVCHLLKKKGYRCRTGDMEEEEEEEEEEVEKKQADKVDDEDEENQDTVEQILKCIIENEANMEAFKEMLGNQNICVRHDPRLLRKESVGGIPPHLHTIHSGSDLNSCHLCVQGRLKKNRRRSRTPRAKRPGEQTVFSVGRFRVTHTDKKGPNPLADSGDQLDQSQDSEEQKEVAGDRKEGGYNLRNMFKDVRPPTESSNGAVPNVGKRRKSVTIFGLRRGSDPSGVKTSTLPGGSGGGGGGRQAGLIKFTQQQPVVLEEPSQTSSLPNDTRVRPQTEDKTEGSKTETTFGSSQDPASASVPLQANTSAPTTTSPPSPNPEFISKNAPGLGPSTGATQAPSSLPIPTPVPSGQTFKMATPTMEKDKEGKREEEGYSPGPLQTSTPIGPGPGPMPGLTPILSATQPESSSSAGLPFTRPTPSQSSTSSPDLDPGIGASLASISLGSSPTSSFPVKTPSPALSLKTPTSPLALTPSPKLPQTSRNTPIEATKSPSPALTPSPKLPSILKKPSQSPTPPFPLGKGPSPLLARSPSPALSPSPKPVSSPRVSAKSTTTKGDTVITPSEREHEGARTLETVEKAIEKSEMERVGILKTDKLSPVTGDFKGVVLSSPSDLLSTDRLSSLPVSPSRPLSPSSPQGGRMSSVTIVKASPDSKREFSVVTMVDEEEPSISVRKAEPQGGETSELWVESADVGVSQGGELSTSVVVQSEGQRGETSPEVGSMEGQADEPSVVVVGPTLSQEKDDMVEMEDIRDCTVREGEDRERGKEREREEEE